MLRRTLLKGAAAFPLTASLASPLSALAASSRRRTRPGDPGWPAAAEWAALGKAVGGRLVKVDLAAGRLCQDPR